MGRAFIIGCAIFVVEILYLVSIQNVLAEDRERFREGSAPTPPPATPAPTPSPLPPVFTPAAPDAPAAPSVDTSFPPIESPDPPGDVGGTYEPAVPGPSFTSQGKLAGFGTTSAKLPFGDLGAQIKYCIVFPSLNNNGSNVIPTFDVPICPDGFSPPPSDGGGDGNGDGDGDGGGDGNGGDDGNGGGDGDGGDGDGGGGNGNGGGRGGRSGRVLAASTPEFMGGADGVPGIPNTGSGGNGALGLLIFSFTSTFLGIISLRMTLKEASVVRI